MYDSDETGTLEGMGRKTDLLAFNSEPFPEWVLRQFREGNFMPTFMEALVVGKSFLNLYVDNTALSSCIHASLPIRQYIYGLTGSSLVTEYYREGLEIVGRGVHSFDTVNRRPLPSLERMPSLSMPVREQLLYEMLSADPHLLQALPAQWRLAMAATLFWSQQVRPSTHLIKALVLGFVVCSSCPHELPKMRSEFFIPDTFRRSPKWMPPLHAFAQWQAVYSDAMALNQLLMLPLEPLSPARLYDGKLAMFFALPENGDHLVAMLPVDHQLYVELVSTIVPCSFASVFSTSPPSHPPPRGAKFPSSHRKPPRFQNSRQSHTGDGGGGGGGRGRGHPRGRGHHGGGGQPNDFEQRRRRRSSGGSSSDGGGRTSEPRRAGPASGAGGGGQTMPAKTGSNQVSTRGKSKLAPAVARGSAVPPAKVVISKPPKFTHANRYAFLEGEGSESDDDSSFD